MYFNSKLVYEYPFIKHFDKQPMCKLTAQLALQPTDHQILKYILTLNAF